MYRSEYCVSIHMVHSWPLPGERQDVTRGIAPAFLRYDRNGLDVTITWKAKLSKDEVKWAFSNIKVPAHTHYIYLCTHNMYVYVYILTGWRVGWDLRQGLQSAM